MTENLTMKYQNKLHMIMNSKKTPYGTENEKGKTFLKQLRNSKYTCVVPLNKDETQIMRTLLRVNSEHNYPIDNLCNIYNIDRTKLMNKINNIFIVLEKYFSYENDESIKYNESINDFNYNLSIFDCDFEQSTQNILRAIGCVYTRDLSHKKMSQIKSYLTYDEYEKLLDFLAFYGVLFDEQLEKVRK
ncbi:MAG: hypothetical protein J5634_03505 [Bacilli bacterium]|nr:hypothetical protein [Bacilli bacterium]